MAIDDEGIAISFDDVTFGYDAVGGSIPALEQVTLSIARGEFACIIGGNGSGKSTLAKHMNALLIPDSGHVRVLGHDTSDEDAALAVRPHCGMVFQNPDDQLVASLVEDEVAFGPANLGLPADELRLRVDAALAAVGLVGREKAETSSLSGGQKQRLAVAGALAMSPDIIILDEATSMLDPQGRTDVLAICNDLHAAGMTVVMITHAMEEAAEAERIYVMDAGRLVAQGAPEEILVDTDLLAQLHLAPTFSTALAARLREKGLDLPACVRDETLVAALTPSSTKGQPC